MTFPMASDSVHEVLTVFVCPQAAADPLPTKHSYFGLVITPCDDPTAVLQQNFDLGIFILDTEESIDAFSDLEPLLLPPHVCLAVRNGPRPRNYAGICGLLDFSEDADRPLDQLLGEFLRPFFSEPHPPTFPCDFRPGEIENVVAYSPNGEVFLLTETGIAVIDREGQATWERLAFLVHRPRWFRVNCDGTFFALRTRFAASLIPRNAARPSCTGLRRIELQIGGSVDYTALEFSNTDPNCFAVGFVDGVVSRFQIMPGGDVRRLEERQTALKSISAIRFGPEGSLFCAGPAEERYQILELGTSWVVTFVGPVLSFDFLLDPVLMIAIERTNEQSDGCELCRVDLHTMSSSRFGYSSSLVVLRRLPWLYAYSSESVSIVYASPKDGELVHDTLIQGRAIIGGGGYIPFAIIAPGLLVRLSPFCHGFCRVDSTAFFSDSEAVSKIEQLLESEALDLDIPVYEGESTSARDPDREITERRKRVQAIVERESEARKVWEELTGETKDRLQDRLEELKKQREELCRRATELLERIVGP